MVLRLEPAVVLRHAMWSDHRCRGRSLERWRRRLRLRLRWCGTEGSHAGARHSTQSSTRTPARQSPAVRGKPSAVGPRNHKLLKVDEWWDVVDDNGNPTGAVFRRGDVGWPSGRFHLVVATCVYRSDGKVLMTQRAATKEFAYGWEFPGGSALAGEPSRAAALRELSEETGLEVTPEAMELVGRFTEETALVDFYVAPAPHLTVLELDPAEVMDSRWWPAPRF